MSTSALTMTEESPPPILLTRVLRLLGYLTDPKTLPGKAFTRWEQSMTGTMEKLATNDRYLRFAGRGLQMGFRVRKDMIDATEEMLHSMRIPALSEVIALRNQVRVLHDQLEATTNQLEVALDLLEKIDARGEMLEAAVAANADASAEVQGPGKKGAPKKGAKKAAKAEEK
jgi:hypothetical protein